ncbi:hypothetical protein GCM10023075_47860 [Streptosporangium album]
MFAESFRLRPRVLPKGLALGFSMTPVHSDRPAADSASNAFAKLRKEKPARQWPLCPYRAIGGPDIRGKIELV